MDIKQLGRLKSWVSLKDCLLHFESVTRSQEGGVRLRTLIHTAALSPVVELSPDLFNRFNGLE